MMCRAIFLLLLTLSLRVKAQNLANESSPAPPASPSANNNLESTTAVNATNSTQTTVGNDSGVKKNTVAQPKKSLIKTVKSKKYSKGLYFDQTGHGVVLPEMTLQYAVDAETGKNLTLGDVQINDQTLTFSLVSIAKLEPQLARIISTREVDKPSLVINWPTTLFETAYLEIIEKSGHVVWEKQIRASMIEAWNHKKDFYAKALKQSRLKYDAQSPLFRSQLVFEKVEDLKIPIFDLASQNQPFKFCLSQKEGLEHSSLCSRWYAVKLEKNRTPIMGYANVELPPARVLVNNNAADLQAEMKLDLKNPTLFFAQLSNAISYEFYSKPPVLSLMDISDTDKPGILNIVSGDTRPTNHSALLNPEQYNAFTKLLGFEATIGDERKFWMAPLRADDPVLYFTGAAGGVFKQSFELTEIPKYFSRPYVETDTPTETYYDDFKIYGRKFPQVQVSSDQNTVQLLSADKTEFLWKFKATERGQVNRSYLDVSYAGKKYRSYYETYLGYPREFSVRATAVGGSGQLIFIQELAYNQWLENLFGWTDYQFGRQRWGFSIKAFQTLTKLKIDTAGNSATLSVTNADLKYRLTPGLWGRKESVGFMGSYQSVALGQINSAMLGAGAFWARSMPRIFDDFLNDYVPFFNYPKWVDTEFIYYPVSLTSNNKLNANFALNFHGKVLWSERIFGEAGFGIKRYAIIDQVAQKSATLNTFYGTVGLGYSF